MVKDATYVRCEAKNAESGDYVDGAFKYFGGDANGGDGYFPADFFPYLGKKAQKTYESPIVAVQVVGLEVRKNKAYQGTKKNPSTQKSREPNQHLSL